MGPKGGAAGTTGGSKPRALAFYLPQFHPIPENDEWWGKGFTEWTNVTKARPLFPGHYQPHVPGELGYYDLRVPEVREAQAELARAHGISGFVYYHYWFHGKRLLERPFDEVLASGSPDFPFALCWANEEWTRNWDARSGRVLMPQKFSDEDDLAHIRWLVTAFADERYIKIDGRPLMLIYRPARLPNPQRTAEIWRTEAQRAGFPDLYLCWVESWGAPTRGPEASGLDATVGFMPPLGDTPLEEVGGHRILDYESSALTVLQKPAPHWKRFPSVMVGWDNTARRPYGATLFTGATPDAYGRWLERAVASVSGVREEENFLFLVAWNEWAEGNHLEPDQHFGRAFLEATRAVLLDSSNSPGEQAGGRRSPVGTDDAPGSLGSPGSDDDHVHSYEHDSAVANAAGLVRDLILDRRSTVVGLGAGSGTLSYPLEDAGIPYLGLEIHPVAVELMQSQGINAQQCDLADLDAVQGALEEVPDVGAFTMIDIIEHLAQPQQLLAALSAWSLKHGTPLLVVSISNVAHFDIGLRLLSGQWSPTDTGLLDSSHLRFFTGETLERMVERCGWQVVARNNFSALRSDQYDLELNDEMPVEMIGALRTLSESTNPHPAVKQFVWALRPIPVAEPPTSYLQAVGRLTNGPEHDCDTRGTGQALRNYFRSVGMIVTETKRRSAVHLPHHAAGNSIPIWKRKILNIVHRSERAESVFKKAYGRFR
jgi:2-polyprenyl-3-methyl-5-hydroxy-6-metoxy-1,4-benzoquinol methylase